MAGLDGGLRAHHLTDGLRLPERDLALEASAAGTLGNDGSWKRREHALRWRRVRLSPLLRRTRLPPPPVTDGGPSSTSATVDLPLYLLAALPADGDPAEDALIGAAGSPAAGDQTFPALRVDAQFEL